MPKLNAVEIMVAAAKFSAKLKVADSAKVIKLQVSALPAPCPCCRQPVAPFLAAAAFGDTPGLFPRRFNEYDCPYCGTTLTLFSKVLLLPSKWYAKTDLSPEWRIAGSKKTFQKKKKRT